ncbi:glutaredoxin family protein [Kocuria marina]|uniref:glutaredoxin family protein n=1 Tax=Kocuria marina TaxID=223184 RepID=UPI002989B495|nr:glutaredoxin family protein [Kocuria marina]MCT1722229.1 glutaredoxin family protein [Kocuria marina]MCT1733988.1 glutaredoxin family protein [Kocuria marina]
MTQQSVSPDRLDPARPAKPGLAVQAEPAATTTRGTTRGTTTAPATATARETGAGAGAAGRQDGRERRRTPLLSGADWTRPRPAHTVTLLTKPGCHLCEDAREVVTGVCEQTGSEYRERDITGDLQLLRDYAEYIPVVFVDGAPWDRLRIDAARLRAVLS